MSDPNDLSGEWDGVFNYPHGLPPTGFRATLRDQAGALTGETVEEGDAEEHGTTLIALIEGHRDGAAVAFTKRYDTLGRAYYVVGYDGKVASDGEEISGRWTIPGVWSDTFLMVRSAAALATAAREIKEEVR